LRRAPEQLVALFPIGVALISLLGYAYSAEGMYGLGELQRMALPTAASLFVVGVGILCARSRRRIRFRDCQRSCGRSPRASNAAALGVVYGDIGTSTLYGLKQQGTQKQRPANSGGLVVLLPSGHLH
jgi:hypothetical protein